MTSPHTPHKAADNGRCTSCGYRKALRRDGTVMPHYVGLVIDGLHRQRCPGSYQLPEAQRDE